MDVSNLAKIISLYERMGVIQMTVGKVNGRKITTPTVVYDEIAFQINPTETPPKGRAILVIARRR